MEKCHQALIKAPEKPERWLILRIIDSKDHIILNTSIDSFISGFQLAWKLSAELNNYENERLASPQVGGLGARPDSKRKEQKNISSSPLRLPLVWPCVPPCYRKAK